ncbi:hypothetical protein ACOSQ2_029533 [Xanthoceras sorbifolium]
MDSPSSSYYVLLRYGWSCYLRIDNSTGLFALQHLRSLNLAFNLLDKITLVTLMLTDTNLPDSSGNLKSLSKLDLGGCNFTGPLPTSMANLTQLEYLDLSSNNFSGPIPSFIQQLGILDLSSNNLSGKIPSCLIEGVGYLYVLSVRRNSLYRTIPDRFPRNCGLQSMNGNQQEGLVPKSLSNCAKLEVSDLGSNKINDAFPCWLKDVSSLHALNMMSPDSWPMLQIMDLASNNFTGRLPQKGLTTRKALMVDEHKSQLKHL